MTFTKPTDKAIINRMAENFLKMKKLRSRYGTLFFMSIVILTVQCIFFIVGGFNVYMLEGIVMNFLVFYFGTKKFDSVTAQYVLMAVNIVAAAAFIIWNPVSDLLLRLGIVQHFYLALESYLFLRIGAQKKELSMELGYPYFNELAAYQQEKREYEPEHRPAEFAPGEPESPKEIAVPKEEMPYRRQDPAALSMDDLDMSAAIAEHTGQKYESCYSSCYNTSERFADQYRQEARIVPETPEYDRDLLYKNAARFKRFRLIQTGIWIIDIFMAYIAITDVITLVSGDFMSFFKFFDLFGVIVATIVTVTCLDNKNNIKCALFSFLATGVFLTVVLLDVSYLAYFLILALQMLGTYKLSDEDRYLRAQFGYPYFKENMVHLQYADNSYHPEHAVNFRNSGMDEI
ncbi:MAG: hypothetical protein ILP22_01970 [Oscillospiraceae bacterium]|nr:hypothetical protein [Oscillospiraceae bacterium]